MDIKKQLNNLKAQMRLNEMADDGYYLSLQYKEDCRTLYNLEKLLKNNSSK